MRSAIIYTLLFSFVLIQGCKDKNHVFVRHTDVEEAGLKGKVRSIVTYQCALDSSAIEHCAVSRKIFNAQGFLVEQILDSTSSHFLSYKYLYNNDGLLAKRIFSSNIVPSWEETYQYSFSDRKKIIVSRQPNSLSRTIRIDSAVSSYDDSGHESEYRGHDINWANKYDERGFLISKKSNSPGGASEISYVNDDKGRVLKTTWLDGRRQVFVYDKDGNEIQQTNFDSLGRKTSEYYTGYCEFDKNGNYLKRISFCPQTKDMRIDRRIIEYY